MAGIGMEEAKAKPALDAKARAERTIPDNLDSLDLSEPSVRTGAIKAIHADPAMMDHVELLEAVMDHIDFHSVWPPNKSRPRDSARADVQRLGVGLWADAARVLPTSAMTRKVSVAHCVGQQLTQG